MNKTKLDKKHAFLAILVAVVMLSAFVGMASAIDTWHLWDDAYPGTPAADDGLNHKLDAYMTRSGYGDGSRYAYLTDGDVAWWYAMEIVGGEEGIVFREQSWQGVFYCNIPEDDVPTDGIVYCEVYSVAEADGALERRLAHGSVTVEEIIDFNGGPGVGCYRIVCPDDPLTSQIVPPDCKVAVRVRYAGDGTFGLGYNGPDGHGQTPTRIVAPHIIGAPALIGNFVWNDYDVNGIQDNGEPGIGNVKVELHNSANGELVMTTTTNESGYYRFVVGPGTYYLVFEAPEGYHFSPKDQGSDDSIDSDASTTTGRTDDITITVNQIDLTWDAGIPPLGTGTPGYWKNHPEAWPVEVITIGGVTYTKDEAIANMGMPEKGDKTYTMFRALVAAKLNVMVGNDDSCIADTISAADAWLGANPVGSKVKGKDLAWKNGEPLYEELDDYNNGDLPCAKSRDVL